MKRTRSPRESCSDQMFVLTSRNPMSLFFMVAPICHGPVIISPTMQVYYYFHLASASRGGLGKRNKASQGVGVSLSDESRGGGTLSGNGVG